MIKTLAISSLKELSVLTAWLSDIAIELNLSSNISHKSQIILDDFISNIFVHNPKNQSIEVKIKAQTNKNSLIFQVVDNGKAFNLFNSKAADITSAIDDRAIGGLGLHLVKNLADNIEYFYEKNQNINIITIAT